MTELAETDARLATAPVRREPPAGIRLQIGYCPPKVVDAGRLRLAELGLPQSQSALILAAILAFCGCDEPVICRVVGYHCRSGRKTEAEPDLDKLLHGTITPVYPSAITPGMNGTSTPGMNGTSTPGVNGSVSP
jgi:hypothetical protein